MKDFDIVGVVKQLGFLNPETIEDEKGRIKTTKVNERLLQLYVLPVLRYAAKMPCIESGDGVCEPCLAKVAISKLDPEWGP